VSIFTVVTSWHLPDSQHKNTSMIKTLAGRTK